MTRQIPASLDGTTVAFVGLGRMGSAMVGRLLDAEVALAVYNRTQSKADPFVERGATRLTSLAAASRLLSPSRRATSSMPPSAKACTPVQAATERTETP